LYQYFREGEEREYLRFCWEILLTGGRSNSTMANQGGSFTQPNGSAEGEMTVDFLSFLFINLIANFGVDVQAMFCIRSYGRPVRAHSLKSLATVRESSTFHRGTWNK
jgi:hypothetical protein